MFIIQKKRYFPLPEYELEDNRVQVTITGRVVEIAYARQLAEYPDLTLEDILLLDRVQKQTAYRWSGKTPQVTWANWGAQA